MDHLGPAFGRETPELLLHQPERESLMARLLDLPPMSIGVQAEVANRHLPLIRDMRGHPGDELQVVHRLLLFGLFPITVDHLALFFREREPLERKKRPDHVLSHPLGLDASLGPHPAVDVETRMPPGENALGPFGAQKLLADKIGQDLSFFQYFFLPFILLCSSTR